eukprot:14165168-Heterocapsa_arctica.AAC.1
MESFGKIAHIQSNLLAQLGSAQEGQPTQPEGAQTPGLGPREPQEDPPIVGADIPVTPVTPQDPPPGPAALPRRP